MALWQNVKRAFKELVRSESGAPAQPPARRPGFQLEVDGGLDIGPHGQKKLEVESEAVVAYVSRHGFQARGATCPRCVWLAARPGEWEKVHKNRHGIAYLLAHGIQPSARLSGCAIGSPVGWNGCCATG